MSAGDNGKRLNSRGGCGILFLTAKLPINTVSDFFSFILQSNCQFSPSAAESDSVLSSFAALNTHLGFFIF